MNDNNNLGNRPSALRSLIQVLSIIIFLCSAGWIFLRYKAESEPLRPPFDHALFREVHADQQRLLWVRLRTPDTLADLKEITTRQLELHKALDAASKNRWRIGYWLDVRFNGEGEAVISRQELLSQPTVEGWPPKPVEIAKTEECQRTGLLTLPEFAELLMQNTAGSAESAPLLLNLISRRPGLEKRILEIVADSSQPTKAQLAQARVVFHSESEGILKALREARPTGIFGTSQATLLQLEMLSHFGLAPLSKLKADALISAIEEPLNSGQPRVRESLINEARRRRLKVYWGPASDVATARRLFDQQVDGVLLNSSEILPSLLTE
ncbi:MAG TPA: hypothetical protein PLZ57_12620 [Pseudobdellovibrionaceae bacterium]|nr:hypothetical protein [Pseudobdellovibrionaceae bacterium]